MWDVVLPLGDFCELRVSISIPPYSSVPKGGKIPFIIEGSLPEPPSPHGRVMGRTDRDVKPPWHGDLPPAQQQRAGTISGDIWPIKATKHRAGVTVVSHACSHRDTRSAGLVNKDERDDIPGACVVLDLVHGDTSAEK